MSDIGSLEEQLQEAGYSKEVTEIIIKYYTS
jgi:hypothetical protein